MHILEKNTRLQTAKQSLVNTHFCLSKRTNPPKKNERKEIKRKYKILAKHKTYMKSTQNAHNLFDGPQFIVARKAQLLLSLTRTECLGAANRIGHGYRRKNYGN